MVNYTTFFISFYSQGVIDTLYPARAVPGGISHEPQVAGQDAFKYLSTHSDSSLPNGFKNRVRNALRMGQAISVELTLCTRRYMGFERFLVHWTPLKGERGEVAWIVVTLGSGDL